MWRGGSQMLWCSCILVRAGRHNDSSMRTISYKAGERETTTGRGYEEKSDKLETVYFPGGIVVSADNMLEIENQN